MSEIGKLKLALFKNKLDSVINVYRGDKEYDDTFPISMELSLTNLCNLACVWCCDSLVRRKYQGHLDKNILFNLFDELKIGGSKGITVEGGGEPTLHPDFEEIVQRIKDSGMAVGLFSNGVKIEAVENNIDSFEWIRISLDADNPYIFKKYKGQEYFEVVMENIERLARKKNKTLLGVGYVATKFNLGNIEDVIERLREAGVDYFYLRPVEDNPRFASFNDMNWVKQYKTDKFDVIVNYTGRVKGGNAGLPCICHSISNVITADASVYICGRLHISPTHQPIGNLKTQSFYDIWNGSKRKIITKSLLKKEYTKKNCPVCRITKYNEFVAEIVKAKTVNFI